MSPRMVPMKLDILNTRRMVEILAAARATIVAFDEEKDTVCSEPLVAAIEQLRKSLEP